MKEAKIINVVDTITEIWRVEELYEGYRDGKIITIPEFLQRKLLKDKWHANKYQNAKEYIASIFKGTCSFDNMSLMFLEDLIEIVKKNMSEDPDVTKQEEYEKLYDQLERSLSQGAVYVCMDGQSRIILAIKTYIEGLYTLGGRGRKNVARGIILEIDGQRSNKLSNTFFPKLGKNVQKLFLDQKVSVNVVIGFSALEDIIEALINKQKGFAWAWFQIAKQKGRFTLFTIRLIDQITKKFSETFEKTTGTIPDDYKTDRDGDQLILTQLAYCLEWGKWLKPPRVKELFQDDIKISSIFFEKAQKYANLFMVHLGKTKTTIAPFINFVLLQELMTNPHITTNSTNLFLKQCTLPTYEGKKVGYVIKVPADFFMYIWKLHKKLINTRKKHPASYIDGEENKEGYKASCGAQDNTNIFRRMELLIANIEWNVLINKGILERTEMGSKMPSQDDVLVDKDFNDNHGKEIKYISDLDRYDRSHRKSKTNGGVNDLKNLENELASPNRSRGSKNMKDTKKGYSPNVSKDTASILAEHK